MLKIFVPLAILLIGAIAFTGKRQNLNGTWLLDTRGKFCEPVVLRIQFGNGYYSARIDMPDQQIFDKAVELKMQDDSIQVLLDKKNDCCLKLAQHDSLLLGRSIVDGRSEKVRFYRHQ